MAGRDIISFDFITIIIVFVVVIIAAVAAIRFTRNKPGCVGIFLID